MQAQITPDVEKAVIAFLAGHDAVRPLCEGVRSEITGPYPILRVIRAGGPSSRRLDRPLLFIDAYGADPTDRADGEREQLHLLSRTALAAVFELERAGAVEGCDVSNVAIATAHQWLPDPLTKQGRYHNAVVVHARTPKQ